jgi:hypothetical protein
MPGLWQSKDAGPRPETNYFVFFTEADRQSAKVTMATELPPRYANWMSGSRLPIEVPNPLVYTISAEDEGILRPYFRNPGAPLMSDELIGVLQKAGVDNLDTYNAVIREIRTGKEHHNYKAVNIIGLVSGADMAKSQYTGSGLSDDPVVGLWFSKLVLDEQKIAGQLLFRLAENVSIVLAHKKVVDAIKASNIPGLRYLAFANPASYAG